MYFPEEGSKICHNVGEILIFLLYFFLLNFAKFSHIFIPNITIKNLKYYVVMF